MRLRASLVRVTAACVGTWLATELALGGPGSPDEPGVESLLHGWYDARPLTMREMQCLRVQGMRQRPYEVRYASTTAAHAEIVEPEEAVPQSLTECAELLERSNIARSVGELTHPSARTMRLERGYLVFLRSVGLVFAEPGKSEVRLILDDLAVSAMHRAGNLVVVSAGATPVVGESRGAVAILGPANGVPVPQRRVDLPALVLAASLSPAGEILALTPTSIVGVPPGGVPRVLYGTIGLKLPEGIDRLTWARQRPNSVVSVGRDIVIGVDFGLVLLRWDPTVLAYEERWALPPGYVPDVLLEVLGVTPLR